MGNSSIDVGLKNIFQAYCSYRKGKKPSPDLDSFQYKLEQELRNLSNDLQNGGYKHGAYRKFIVRDNKTREISVATVRDKVVHRLIYDFLNQIYDKTFIYDVWSCRKGKGLLGAIERTQNFLKKYADCYVWRGDIQKFFDSVSHDFLLSILSRKIGDTRTFSLLENVIQSFSVDEYGTRGIPISNLTSQIFANIYLNALDRLVKHRIKPLAYLRYGDDFIIIMKDKISLEQIRSEVVDFLERELQLSLHPKNNLIVQAKHGLGFLGVIIYPLGRKLNKRNQARIKNRLNLKNAGSYWGMVTKHGNEKSLRKFQWKLAKLM